MERTLVLHVAGLGWNLVEHGGIEVAGLTFHPADSVFPAVTCTAQASFRTASPAGAHGMVANGRYLRELCKPMFWEQSARLVEGERIWAGARRQGRRVGMLFWQQSLGEDLDLVLSPRPVHKHSGGMIQDCYSQPEPLYADLSARVGRRFNLMNYWGPLTSRKSSDWIAGALCEVMSDQAIAPDILFGYLPHLDYDLQKYGPGSPQVAKAVQVMNELLATLLRYATQNGYKIVVAGDYAIGPVTGDPIYPNRVLREAGLFRMRSIQGRAYPDFFSAEAFAMVDHEIGHVFVRDASRLSEVRDVLERIDGIDEVLDREGQAERGVAHSSGGEFLVVAEPGRWFAYPWWTERREAPDFATHVDIHNKPGFDPCELFFGWPPGSVSLDASRVRGSHGRDGQDRRVAWASTLQLPSQPSTFIELAAAVGDSFTRPS